LKFSGDEFDPEKGKIVTSAKRMRFNYLSSAEREHIEQKLREVEIKC